MTLKEVEFLFVIKSIFIELKEMLVVLQIIV